MNNDECAKVFIAAIQQFASKSDNLDNFEGYLSSHFDKWLEKFANTPEGIAGEMKNFAEMSL